MLREIMNFSVKNPKCYISFTKSRKIVIYSYKYACLLNLQ